MSTESLQHQQYKTQTKIQNVKPNKTISRLENIQLD